MIYAAKDKVIDARFGDKKVLKMMLGDTMVYELPVFIVTCILENVTSNAPATVEIGDSLSVTLSGVDGNKVQANSVVVMMGDTDITSTAYDHSTKTITIASVTEDISITAIGRPYDAEVEYLQSNGNQWIDTGINLRQKLTVTFNCAITKSITATKVLTGAFYDNSTYPKMQLTITSSQRWGTPNASVASLYSISGITTNAWVALNTKYTPVITNKASQNSDATIYIFARSNESNYVPIDGLRVYWYYITDNDGNKLRDFIPVKDNNVGYLYDKVSGQLFGNVSGSGAFTYGEEV